MQIYVYIIIIIFSNFLAQNVNDGLYRHKVMPSYHVSKEVEFQPAVPCLKCFPGYKPHNFESECLGVQNVVYQYIAVNLK